VGEFPELARVTSIKKFKKVRFEHLKALWKIQNEAIPTVLPGKRTSGRHSSSVSRQKMCQNGHNAVRKRYGNMVVKLEMGQESE
jgi:hypothetical protein